MPKYIDNLYKSLSPLCKSVVDDMVRKRGGPDRPIREAINEDGDSPGLSTKDHRLFQSILGMTGWLQTTCRPDISLAQSRIAQHSACPSESAIADLGTKILDKFTFQKLRGLLMHDLEYLCSARQN